MSSSVRSGKGDNRTQGSSQDKTEVGSGEKRSREGLPRTRPASGAYGGLAVLLGHLIDRHDGWLRIVPESDAQKVFIKWKFNSGKWPNHYVMVVGECWQIEYLFALLVAKLYEVDDGLRIPTTDHRF